MVAIGWRQEGQPTRFCRNAIVLLLLSFTLPVIRGGVVTIGEPAYEAPADADAYVGQLLRVELREVVSASQVSEGIGIGMALLRQNNNVDPDNNNNSSTLSGIASG